MTVLGLSGRVYAQFSTGTTVVGGSLSYSKYLNDQPNASIVITDKSTTISPRVGTFLKDNLELGLQLSYVHGIRELEGYVSQTYSNDMIMLAPYIRNYFPLNEWAGFYMQGGIAYGRGRFGEKDLDESWLRTRLWAASIAPGITIRLGEKVGVDLQANLLQFTRQTSGHKDDFSKTESKPVDNFNIGPNFSKLSLGISFIL